MRELSAVELMAVSGGLQMRPPPVTDFRRIVIAILERIIRILGGGPTKVAAA
jgi:hypothetical protein